MSVLWPSLQLSGRFCLISTETLLTCVPAVIYRSICTAYTSVTLILFSFAIYICRMYDCYLMYPSLHTGQSNLVFIAITYLLGCAGVVTSVLCTVYTLRYGVFGSICSSLLFFLYFSCWYLIRLARQRFKSPNGGGLHPKFQTGHS